jgi:CheY-like chemotaxis protein
VGGYTQVDEGDYAVVTITDTGAGITPQEKERIFEPFYTKKVMGKSGTGLGMAVVWGTVKDHSGYIDVNSTVGEGTTIKLYFPVTREVLADTPPPQGAMLDEYYGDGEQILVVDDVAEQRDIASEILGRLNYTVTTVESGEKAVDYLQSNATDLVILDMIMEPGMDGAQTYKEILKHHPGQKAIIVSGFSETARVKKAQSLGAGAYVKKPYLFASLGQAVRTELSA